MCPEGSLLHLRPECRLLSPVVHCDLFLHTCYSRATVCAWNIKHSLSFSLSSFSQLVTSRHRLVSIRTTAHTSAKCQPKSSRFFSAALSLFFTHSFIHTLKTRSQSLFLFSSLFRSFISSLYIRLVSLLSIVFPA